MTLRQLRYFVAAADAGTMTGAGQEEHVSQSAISLAVGDLERAVGAQLFLRHRARGLTLTSAGRHLLGDARELLARTEEMITSTQSLGGDVRGRLAVACYETIAPFVMPGLVTSFAEKHPLVDVELLDGAMAELHRYLRTGTCELFIAYDLDLEPWVSTTPLQTTSTYVLLPEEHSLGERREIGLEELVDEPLVLYDQPQASHYFLSLFEARNLEPRIGHRTSNFELVRSLVARRQGYSLLIQRPASDLSYEGLPLACRSLRDPAHSQVIVVGAPAGWRPTQRAAAFIAHCEDVLASGT